MTRDTAEEAVSATMSDGPTSYFDRSRRIAAHLADGHPSTDPLELAAYLRAVGTADELAEKIEMMIRSQDEFNELMCDARTPHGVWGRPGIGFEEVGRAGDAMHVLYVRLCELLDYAERAEGALLRKGWRYNPKRDRLESAEGGHRRKHYITEEIEHAYDYLMPGHEPNPEAPRAEWRTAENTRELREKIAEELYLFPEPLVDPRPRGPIAKAVDAYWDGRWKEAVKAKHQRSGDTGP